MNWLVGGPPGLAYQREVLKRRHDSTPPGSWLREQYERHRMRYTMTFTTHEPTLARLRAEHSVEDAFALPTRSVPAFSVPPSHPDHNEHNSVWVVEDAFDPGPSAYLRPVEERRAARDAFFRRLDEILGREGVLDGLTAPVSDYVPTIAREFYDDGA